MLGLVFFGTASAAATHAGSTDLVDHGEGGDGVARGREPGERRDHYRFSSDTWYEVVTRRDEILARWERDLQEGIKAVGPDTPAGARLEETRQYFEFLHGEISRVMARWRERRSAGRAQ